VSELNITLDDAEASKTAEVLVHLAALIGPDDGLAAPGTVR